MEVLIFYALTGVLVSCSSYGTIKSITGMSGFGLFFVISVFWWGLLFVDAIRQICISAAGGE